MSETQKKNADGGQICILGDRIEDFILISKHKRSRVNLSMNYDLFTRDVINSYTSHSGVDVLHRLLAGYYAGEDTNVSVNKGAFTSKTISEWREESVRKEGKEEKHLYLEKHIGLTEVNEATIELDEENMTALQTADTVLVYNMSSKEYVYQGGKINIFESMKKADNIIIRTKFEKDQKCTQLLEDLSGTGLQKKAILLFNVNELRRGGFNIRKGVSWEQLMTETYDALKKIDGDKRFKAIVVCFNHEGCLVVQGDEITLICYGDEIEGDFVIRKNKRAFSPILTMQAVLAIGLRKNGDLKDIVIIGLKAMRKLISHGFEVDATYPCDFMVEWIKRVGADADNRMLVKKFKESDLSHNMRIANFLQQENDMQPCADGQDSIFPICKKIVREGPLHLDVPYLRSGTLLTFDRTEIEQLRSIHQIFKLYISDHSITKPFSICVFGQPGSGKSFAVKQIAKSLNIGEKAILEFNLSQMSSPRELFLAFHQIRDAGLKGELPLAFFDEFDSKLETELGWLKYFLAPMQDGEFREDAIAHFIGRAIFVFAGGTCNTTEQFKNLQKNENAKASKLPDFLSRIKGYIDITGPNPMPCTDESKEKPDGCWSKSLTLMESDSKRITKISKAEQNFIRCCAHRNQCCTDKSHYLRRATLLRTMLEHKLNKSEEEEIQIDENVLDAFLKVTQYLHGARSLEAIIQTSESPSTQYFTSSCIYNNYLDLYVSDDFEEYLNQDLD